MRPATAVTLVLLAGCEPDPLEFIRKYERARERQPKECRPPAVTSMLPYGSVGAARRECRYDPTAAAECLHGVQAQCDPELVKDACLRVFRCTGQLSVCDPAPRRTTCQQRCEAQRATCSETCGDPVAAGRYCEEAATPVRHCLETIEYGENVACCCVPLGGP